MSNKKSSKTNPQPSQAADASVLDADAELQAIVDEAKDEETSTDIGGDTKGDIGTDIGGDRKPEPMPVTPHEAASFINGAFFFVLEKGLNVNYPIEAKAKGVEVLTPVMEKRGAPIPAWAARYREEIEAGMFFGSVLVQTYMQVKAANELSKQEAEEAGATGTDGSANDAGGTGTSAAA